MGCKKKKKIANIEFAIFIGEEYLVSDRASIDIGINTGLWLSVSHLMQSSDCVCYIYNIKFILKSIKLFIAFEKC